VEGASGSTACDVYSFGIITWFLMMGEVPFEGFSDPDLLKQAISRGERPPIKKDTPVLLQETMEQCWAHEAEKRTSFSVLVGEERWDDMVADAVSGGEKRATAMWAQFESEKVPWNIFVTAFCAFLGVKVNQQDNSTLILRCLADVLDIELDRNGTGTVTIQNFQRMLAWFGPIGSGEGEGHAFLASIVNLLKQPWFHGQVDGNNAVKRIKASGKRNGFLIRFSTTDKTYTMTYFDRKNKENPITNVRLDKKYMKDITTHVEQLQKKMRLEPVEYERQYARHFRKQMEVGGYANMEDIRLRRIDTASSLTTGEQGAGGSSGLASLSDTIEYIK